MRFDTNSTVGLLRQLLVVACEPGALGAMAGDAAPMDPIFFALHPTFEKALHILSLSPSYQHYEWNWVEHYCGDGVSGGGLHDKLPFTGARAPLRCFCPLKWDDKTGKKDRDKKKGARKEYFQRLFAFLACRCAMPCEHSFAAAADAAAEG